MEGYNIHIKIRVIFCLPNVADSVMYRVKNTPNVLVKVYYCPYSGQPGFPLLVDIILSHELLG